MSRSTNPHALDPFANALGWFSLGLGAAELIAPKALSRWLGMRHGTGILKAYGAREIVAGVGILAARNKAPFVWSRVAGDALDIASLVSVAIERPSKRRNAALALAAVAGVTAADIVCGVMMERRKAETRRRQAQLVSDYRKRSGFPRAVDLTREGDARRRA